MARGGVRMGRGWWLGFAGDSRSWEGVFLPENNRKAWNSLK